MNKFIFATRSPLKIPNNKKRLRAVPEDGPRRFDEFKPD